MSCETNYNLAVSASECQTKPECRKTNLSSYTDGKDALTCGVGDCMRYLCVPVLKETKSFLVLAFKLGELTEILEDWEKQTTNLKDEVAWVQMIFTLLRLQAK